MTYNLTSAGRAARAAPWTCPICNRTMRVAGKGPHWTSCTADHDAIFWAKIDKTDTCWLYREAVNTTGYGMVNYRGKKNTVAHRLAWKLLRGPIPAGILVLHKCDTPRCCNPDHLFLGTDADNCADKVAKRRHAFGERNPRARLKDGQIREIRQLRAGGMTHIAIGQLFGIRPTTSVQICRRHTWKHIQ